VGKETDFYLDVGCGPVISKVNKPPADCVSIVLDKDYQTLKSRQDVINYESLAVCADARALPFKANSIKRTSETHLLEHLLRGDEQLALCELIRTLKPGERAVFAVPHPYYEWVMGKIVSEYHSPKMHQQVISSEGLETSVMKAGLKVTTRRLQNWPTAFALVRLGLMARYSPNVVFKPQIGFDVKNQNAEQSKIKKVANKLIKLMQDNPINGVLNRLFPFETYIEAVKPCES
jgi:hypothetical protein